MSEPRGQRSTLHLFRFCLVIAVLVVLSTWLAGTFDHQQNLARQANWQAQVRQLALQVQWLHGRWLNEHHAAALVIPARDGGQAATVQMSASGWPQPAAPWRDASCLLLWQQLQEWNPVSASAATLPTSAFWRGGACEFRQAADAISYRWLDGEITTVETASTGR